MYRENLSVPKTRATRTLRAIPLVIVLLLSGCQTAFLTFPGGALQGEEMSADSFAFANEYSLLQLEVRPKNPYSIWLRVTLWDGELYIDAAEGRKWHGYLKDNPNVRIKLGDRIYKATAVIVTDRDLQKKFLEGRTIYRIDPRL